MRVWLGQQSGWVEKWGVRNLAQRVTEGYFTREEFTSSARPDLEGSEALGSVEITFRLRESLRSRVRISDIN